MNFERFAHPAGFLDVFHQNWWPADLHFDGIPPFEPENISTKYLKFIRIPQDKCENVETPVFVKSAMANRALRNIIRKIFNYQKTGSMKIYFIVGKQKTNTMQNILSERYLY